MTQVEQGLEGDHSAFLCSFRCGGHPLTKSSLSSKGHLPVWLLFCVWADMGMCPSRKSSLNSPPLCPSEPKYLDFWFVYDFKGKVFPLLHLVFPHKSKGGTHQAHLSLRAEKLQFTEWGEGWKSAGAGPPEWIEGGCVRWAQLYFIPPSIIPGPGLLPRQDRGVLSRLETIFVAIESWMGIHLSGGLLTSLLTVSFSQKFMVTPFG